MVRLALKAPRNALISCGLVCGPHPLDALTPVRILTARCRVPWRSTASPAAPSVKEYPHALPEKLMGAMGNLILLHTFLRDLGPAICVGAGHCCCMAHLRNVDLKRVIRGRACDHGFLCRARSRYSVPDHHRSYESFVHERVKSVDQAASPPAPGCGLDGRY